MARYVVEFFKAVMGDNGRGAEVCQGKLEVDAANRADAAEHAKLKFCQQRQLSDWSLHADRVSVAETEYPS